MAGYERVATAQELAIMRGVANAIRPAVEDAAVRAVTSCPATSAHLERPRQHPASRRIASLCQRPGRCGDGEPDRRVVCSAPTRVRRVEVRRHRSSRLAGQGDPAPLPSIGRGSVWASAVADGMLVFRFSVCGPTCSCALAVCGAREVVFDDAGCREVSAGEFGGVGRQVRSQRCCRRRCVGVVAVTTRLAEHSCGCRSRVVGWRAG